MLDLNEIRRDPSRIKSALAKRGIDVDFGELLAVGSCPHTWCNSSA
jgi:hypothetical protein